MPKMKSKHFNRLVELLDNEVVMKTMVGIVNEERLEKAKKEYEQQLFALSCELNEANEKAARMHDCLLIMSEVLNKYIFESGARGALEELLAKVRGALTND